MSPKAIKEFADLTPTYIDRRVETHGIGKLFPEGFVNIRSHETFLQRRKLSLSLLGLNNASKSMPTLISIAEKKFKKWKTGETYNFKEEFGEINFTFFNFILLGKDTSKLVLNKDKKLPYINRNNEVEEMMFQKFFASTIMDFVLEYYSPITRMFPFLNSYNLINPFKRNMKNRNTMKEFLREALKSTTDEDSAYMRGLSVLDDLMLFMLAGADTTSFTMTSVLYFLKKNPTVLEKLKKELEAHGITQGCDPIKNITAEKIQKIDYLSYIIKEVLRMDGPSVSTFPYVVCRDVKI